MTPHDAPSLAMLVTEVGAFREGPLTLIDVGCSGGLYEPARDFMPDLRAVRFDPLISERAWTSLRRAAPNKEE